MAITRRQFVLSGSLAALSLACRVEREPQPPRPLADRALEEILDRALRAARAAGASYADVRLVRRRTEKVQTREDHLVELLSYDSYGLGVRTLVEGAWGFMASSQVDGAVAEEIARGSAALARASARVSRRKVELAPVPAYRDAWRTPMKRDPFDVPVAEKIEHLLALWRDARAVPGVKHATGGFAVLGEWKLFASTEGSLLEQSITRVSCGFEATAVDAARGEFVTRADETPPMQAGWEYIVESPFLQCGRRVAEDVARKLGSDSVAPGVRDLVLAPTNLWLVLHETVGHSTELDRALGYEANFAGTSFATPDKLGKLEYAAPIVTVYADKTTPGGLATCGYDDDGVRTGRWDLVRDGRFVGYQTTREQAAWIGEKASRGTSYAEDFASFPFQRMPNVSLAPQPKPLSEADLVAATDDGIYVTGDGSWSIDHQRYNFQFGGQMFYEIKGGKIARTLRDVAYQSNTLAFWRSCDMVGGAAAWKLCGAMQDGKGEPAQTNAVSHGCPPARFRGVNIVNTREGARA
jgi:TldD protein